MRQVLITVFDSEAGTTTDYSFAASPVRIGRNPLNDLALPFGFVSGWHAVVRFDDSVAKFFDLGSTNGTLLNGRRVQAGEAVVVGELLSVTIGKLELQFRRGAHNLDAAPPVLQGGTLIPATPPGVGQGLPGGTLRPTGPLPAVPAAVGVASGTIDPERVGGAHHPAAASQGDGTSQVQMSDVHQAVHRIGPLFEAYRNSWGALFGELQAAVEAIAPSARGFALSILQREFPDVAREPQYSELAKQTGAPAPVQDPGSGAALGTEMSTVRRMAESLRADEEPPRSPQEAARFMSCVEDVLRASAKAFVELQKGQEQFGNEMGVRTIKEFTALHAAGTPENVLKYLLDWQTGGPHRTQELVGVYADLMIHQVALINGVMEGVRALLSRLDPREIERGVSASWPTRTAATWKHFTERYRDLCQNDKNITELVFGPEFARAYAEVGGEGAGN